VIPEVLLLGLGLETVQATVEASIPGQGPGYWGTQDNLSIFAADDIQFVLHEMNYKISFILFGVSALGVFYYCMYYNSENAYCITASTSH